ncbi:putative NRPS-like enzyme [Mytilinidion resinicola]|uniref:NRPS-like enzyme n=1 Tax=Mytilinidion resinicola TaxID=574789 RepID=A0A6A6YS66_9PEZI|nr:putative NRPS-like enzyme [Mytilinidion resinicola]KAF2811621.1 putative NRPS-like enzyme [Mytilinidion resinicola]
MVSAAIPVDNNRLLPDVIDLRAQRSPQDIFARVPSSTATYGSGFRSVTILELSNAIKRVAWLLEEHLGKGQDHETLAYIGPNDLRYSIIVIAAVKAGYKTFLPSPRNSKAAHISLLSRLACKILVTTNPEPPCVPMILEDYSMRKLQIPSLVELLASHDVPHYPYEKTFEEAKYDPAFILHTSGSTGCIPKPLVYNHSFITRIANVTSLPPPEGFQSLDRFFRSGSFFMTLPGFHVAGIGFSLIVPAFNSSIPVYPLPGPPPTTAAFIEAIQNATIDWAFLPPVVIDELGKDPALLEAVASKLKYLYYTGGSVPRSSGDAVAARMPLYQVMGSSECATFPLLRQGQDEDGHDWNYIQVHPTVQAEFRHRFEDLHELVVVRTLENESYQPVFLHFPDLKEYETRDLFTPHPTKPGLWTHRSRVDDVIVFLNGEKTNPVSFEHEVAKHPEVRTALVVGQQRFEASLLVELVDDSAASPTERLEIVDQIWPTVQKANSQCPAHARVSKSKIILVDPTRPMLRAGKGTVQRQATLDLYSKVLDEVYAEDDLIVSTIPAEDIVSERFVADTVREAVRGVTEWAQFNDDDEFFSLGMDSLQVLKLRRQLKAKLPQNIGLATIYGNSSITLLAKELWRLASQTQSSASDLQGTTLEEITATIQRYVNQIDPVATPPKKDSHPIVKPIAASEVVLLTGSTGTLGSFLLQDLLSQANVAHIYCLNRAANSESLQTSRNQAHQLPTNFPSNRVTFLTADLSKDNFGLEKSLYDTLLSTTTQIIHNAWPVDFNRTLPSFNPSLSGVVALISFAARSPQSPALFFMSSISATINYHQTTDSAPMIPESVIMDPACAAPMGYGQSKYVAERLLDYASHKLGLNATVVRIGQIAGTAENPRGWSRNEWLPSLVISSRFISALPESLGAMDEVDWVPIDMLSGVLIDLVLGLHEGKAGDGLQVFHAVNPSVVSWETLLPTVREVLSEDGEVTVVPFPAWLDLLKLQSVEVSDGGDSEISAETLRRNPGMKLIGFYDELLTDGRVEARTKMDLTRTLQASESMKKLEPIQKEWIGGWVRNWVASS